MDGLVYWNVYLFCWWVFTPFEALIILGINCDKLINSSLSTPVSLVTYKTHVVVVCPFRIGWQLLLVFRGGSYWCRRGYCSLLYEVRNQRKKVFWEKREFFGAEHQHIQHKQTWLMKENSRRWRWITVLL